MAGVVSQLLGGLLRDTSTLTDVIIIAAVIGHAVAFAVVWWLYKSNKSQKPDFKGKLN